MPKALCLASRSPSRDPSAAALLIPDHTDPGPKLSKQVDAGQGRRHRRIRAVFRVDLLAEGVVRTDEDARVRIGRRVQIHGSGPIALGPLAILRPKPGAVHRMAIHDSAAGNPISNRRAISNAASEINVDDNAPVATSITKNPPALSPLGSAEPYWVPWRLG